MGKDMGCLNGWMYCDICFHVRECRAGNMYIDNPVEQAAQISEEVVHEEAVKSAKFIKRDLFREFMAQNPEQTRTIRVTDKMSHVNWKEPYKVMDGPTAPGGNKTGRVKKSKKGTKVYIGVWENP